MKLKVLTIALLAINSFAIGQTYTELFVACSKSYTAVCDLQNQHSMRVAIKDGLDTSNHISFDITTSDIDVFANTFKQFFKQLKNTVTCVDSNSLISHGRMLYLNYLKSFSDTSSPVAGIIGLSGKAKIYASYKISDGKKGININPQVFFNCKVEKIQIEISEGYISNLKAYVNFNNTIYQFVLPFPIGISSVGNFRKYKNCKLFEVNSPVYLNRLSKEQKQIKEIGIKQQTIVKIDSSFYIILSDFINYDYEFQVNRRDYSPKNQKFNLLAGESKILYKDQVSRLFEANIFTDFIGLNEQKPNGLIQTEIAKRININTVQHLLPSSMYGLIKSTGSFQYITPSVTFSKIEQHNRGLNLGNLDSIRFQPGLTDTSRFANNRHRYSTALNLYQYQSFSAGIDLNILYFNNNDRKYSLEINVGARLGITHVIDSLTRVSGNMIFKTDFVNNYSVNTLQLSPEIILVFLPEERFNLAISDRAIFFKAFNSNIELIEFDKNLKGNAKNTTLLNCFQMLMTIRINDNSKLFGKIKFNSEWGNARNNFAQVQVGYSTFILSRK